MKRWLSDFPTLTASAALGQLLILITGLIVCGRLMLGRAFPAGYDGWLMLLFGLATANVAGMIGKRLSDFRYKAAGTSPVNVEAPSNVTVETGAVRDEAPKFTRVTAQQVANVTAPAAVPGGRPAEVPDVEGEGG